MCLQNFSKLAPIVALSSTRTRRSRAKAVITVSPESPIPEAAMDGVCPFVVVEAKQLTRMLVQKSHSEWRLYTNVSAKASQSNTDDSSSVDHFCTVSFVNAFYPNAGSDEKSSGGRFVKRKTYIRKTFWIEKGVGLRVGGAVFQGTFHDQTESMFSIHPAANTEVAATLARL